MYSQKEAEIHRRVFENIAALLGIPDATFEPTGTPPATLDFSGTLSLRGNHIHTVGQVKSVGEPWALRSAIHRLTEHRIQNPEHLPLLVSEFIGPQGRALCKRYRIAYIDLSGNCYLEWGDVYIDKVRGGVRSRTRKRVKSLFSDKASLVIRSALDSPGQPQQVREVSRQLGVSPAWVSQVLNRLVSAGYAARLDRATVISRPLDLLNDWADSYSFARRNDVSPFFCDALTPEEVIGRVGSVPSHAVGRYALTLHAGASLVAPFSKYHEVHIYMESSGLREETEHMWAETLDLQPVETGGNVYLTWPYYREGAFYASRKIDGVWVASDIQLYIDLYNYPIRGREQAEYLMRNRLGHLDSPRQL